MICAVPATRRCIVVGAGLFGLAAARALSGRGWWVEVLESGPAAGHEWSGSKGGARIFRLGYPETHYVDMARRAASLWAALEAASGRRLLRRTGQAGIGDEASLRAVAGALEVAGVPARWLPPREVRERFPHLRCDGPVLFEPDSGVLAADECLRALCETGGFEVRGHARVAELDERADSMTVVTADGHRSRADVVVLCAGPHTLSLLGQPVGVSARPSAPQVAYFRPARGHEHADLPVFIEWGADMVYGLPVRADTGHGETFKVSHHTPYEPLELHQVGHGAPPLPDHGALLAVLTGAVSRLLPALDPVPVATERCVYDNSTDGNLVLDRVGRVVVGCGSSGHGFKFGPLVGEVLADLAEGVALTVDVAPFGLGRPAGH